MDRDYKDIFRRLETTLQEIEQSVDLPTTIERLVEAITIGFGRELGVRAARIYQYQDEEEAYVLKRQVGQVTSSAVGFRIPLHYPPVQALRQEGFQFMEEGDPGLDPDIESVLESGRFAAIALGVDRRTMIAFTLDPGFDASQAIYTLNTIRHVLNLKLRQDALDEAVQESRRIQMSLLPRTDPDFAPFEIHGRSEPAEAVGGDLFDYVTLSKKMLALTIADASGHGLPAALQARDVITGLRVGLEEHFKLVRTIERVNRVISRSNLASRFISIFSAELELNGNLVYCNAGHPPPILLRGGEVHRLHQGGLVLGVDPNAAYEQGFVSFPPGGAMVLFTDGLTEALSPTDEAFGEERLIALLRNHQDEPARALVDRIFETVDRWTGGTRLDDQTAMVVKRH